jgi:hypothetical protein
MELAGGERNDPHGLAAFLLHQARAEAPKWVRRRAERGVDEQVEGAGTRRIGTGGSVDDGVADVFESREAGGGKGTSLPRGPIASEVIKRGGAAGEIGYVGAEIIREPKEGLKFLSGLRGNATAQDLRLVGPGKNAVLGERVAKVRGRRTKKKGFGDI